MMSCIQCILLTKVRFWVDWVINVDIRKLSSGSPPMRSQTTLLSGSHKHWGVITLRISQIYPDYWNVLYCRRWIPSIIEPCLTTGWRSVPAAQFSLTSSLSCALLSPCGPLGMMQNAMASRHATWRHCQPFCFFCCTHFTSLNATALRRDGIWA